jgi:hypothetical protein
MVETPSEDMVEPPYLREAYMVAQAKVVERDATIFAILAENVALREQIARDRAEWVEIERLRLGKQGDV